MDFFSQLDGVTYLLAAFLLADDGKQPYTSSTTLVSYRCVIFATYLPSLAMQKSQTRFSQGW